MPVERSLVTEVTHSIKCGYVIILDIYQHEFIGLTRGRRTHIHAGVRR